MRFSLLLLLISTAFAQSGYRVSQRIPIGGDGGWDYLTVDPEARRVYISHATEVDVLDADTTAVAGKITGLSGVHGIALAPQFNRGFISNGQAGTVTVFDLKTLKRVVDDIAVGKNPDSIIFDDATGRVFAFNGRDSTASVVDAELGAPVGTVTLEGKPEFAAADGANAVYVNIEDKNTMLRIDARKLLVEQKWSLTGCERPSGLAMDRSTRRLFAGCHNKVMVVVNADSGKVEASVPICDGIDATAFDPGLGLIFNSCSDGTITVVHENTPNQFEVVDTIKTQPGSRSMAVDTKRHRLFLPAAEFEQVPARDGQPARRRIMPGTFSILVLEK